MQRTKFTRLTAKQQKQALRWASTPLFDCPRTCGVCFPTPEQIANDKAKAKRAKAHARGL